MQVKNNIFTQYVLEIEWRGENWIFPVCLCSCDFRLCRGTANGSNTLLWQRHSQHCSFCVVPPGTHLLAVSTKLSKQSLLCLLPCWHIKKGLILQVWHADGRHVTWWVAVMWHHLITVILKQNNFLSRLTEKKRGMTDNLKQRKTEAFWGLFVGDAVAMPVHWYYNPRDIHTGYGGWLTGYRAPNKQHPSSILSLSAVGEWNEKGEQRRVQTLLKLRHGYVRKEACSPWTCVCGWTSELVECNLCLWEFLLVWHFHTMIEDVLSFWLLCRWQWKKRSVQEVETGDRKCYPTRQVEVLAERRQVRPLPSRQDLIYTHTASLGKSSKRYPIAQENQCEFWLRF